MMRADLETARTAWMKETGPESKLFHLLSWNERTPKSLPHGKYAGADIA